MLSSTPYYMQANGQAESSNKILKDLLRKIIQEKPRSWHEVLPQILGTYNTCKRTSTSTSHML